MYRLQQGHDSISGAMRMMSKQVINTGKVLTALEYRFAGLSRADLKREPGPRPRRTHAQISRDLGAQLAAIEQRWQRWTFPTSG